MDAVAGMFGIGGVGFLLDGTRDLCRKTNTNAALKFAVGITCLAIGAALLYKVSEVAQCPIDQLGDLLSARISR